MNIGGADVRLNPDPTLVGKLMVISNLDATDAACEKCGFCLFFWKTDVGG